MNIPPEILEILKQSYFENTVQAYLIALAIFFGILIITFLFKTIIIMRLKKLAKLTKSTVDDMLVEAIYKIRWPFYSVIALYVSIHSIIVSDSIMQIGNNIMMIVFVYYAVKVMQQLVNFFMYKSAMKKGELKPEDKASLNMMKSILNALIWIIAFILILSNFGINVTSLIAGLGIGGIAIAFALQNVLGDIFASFSIHLDKPFKVGDYIVIGEDSGTVMKIGLKSTRIQTLQGQELIVSNKELTEVRVHNYKIMKKRRVSFNFGVLYETPVSKLEKIPSIVKDIISKIDQAELYRAHFTDFGDFSLNYSVMYYILSKDYGLYKNIQQEINIELLKRFAKEKIEMAYPTQTVFLKK